MHTGTSFLRGVFVLILAVLTGPFSLEELLVLLLSFVIVLETKTGL